MRLIRRLEHSARVATMLVLAACSTMLFSSCEDAEEPLMADTIKIFSGNNQYSKVGTELQFPLEVNVRMADDAPAQGFVVEFKILSGDATLSSTAVAANDAGQAGTRLTLGATTGITRVRATLSTNVDLFVDFTAEAGDFFCLEEDPDPNAIPNFGNSTGLDLFLVTRHSRLHEKDGQLVSGVIRIRPTFTPVPFATTNSVVKFDEEFGIQATPKDGAFSRSDDYYVARREIDAEVVRITTGGSYPHFALLEQQALSGFELDTSPGTVLMGCDAFGPFAIGCRDTLMRFTEATYSGVGIDACSDDAFAVDPVSQDLYFIYEGDNWLKRLPVDSLVERPLESVTKLTQEEVNDANGMVVNDDGGDIFLLVDNDTTRVILRITPSGTKTVEVDFVALRGAGTLAGVQRDLAINRQGGGVLFTIDTENNMLLAWDILQQVLTELPPDPSQNEESISVSGSSGERIGLSAVP